MGQRQQRDRKAAAQLEDAVDALGDLLDDFSADDFRLLCKVAIREGYASVQDIVTKFGDAIPRNVDKISDNVKWAVPNPVKTREILTFFSTLETSTGSKLPWRHAQCAQPEAEPALPNSQRTAGAHPHSRPA